MAPNKTLSQIAISEIFGPTIQGEGALIGKPTIFVRTGGCDYRCRWCDTPYAVHSHWRQSWTQMSIQAVWNEIIKLSGSVPLTVSLSGGNPAIQPFEALINTGKQSGYEFALETQGSIACDWFEKLDRLTLSPKGPSSGMVVDWKAFEACLEAAGTNVKTVLKFVIFDDDDYDFARNTAVRYPSLKIYLQPGNPQTGIQSMDNAGVDKGQRRETIPDEGVSDTHLNMLMDRLRWLTKKATHDHWFEVTILPQLHVLLWGNQRGV